MTIILGLLPILMGGTACAGASPKSLKNNRKAPIEVTSDALEVLQQDNKAIFSGHVVAVQGNVRLTADKMTVFYAGAGDKKANKKEGAEVKKAASGNPQGSIKKIEATGSVFLATPQETASGTSGTYDVEHQEIHLNRNVVLTRGKNVLKGENLTYNFATGRSVMSAGGEEKSGSKGGRVRALFVPENNKSGSNTAESSKESGTDSQ